MCVCVCVCVRACVRVCVFTLILSTRCQCSCYNMTRLLVPSSTITLSGRVVSVTGTEKTGPDVTGLADVTGFADVVDFTWAEDVSLLCVFTAWDEGIIILEI